MTRLPVLTRSLVAALLLGGASGAAPAAARVIDGVAAVVNEDVILVSEINEAMRPIIREYRQRYSGDDLRRRLTEVQETVVLKAIEDRLILQVARRVGIAADKAQVDERLEAVVRRFGSDDSFEAELRRRAMTAREYRSQVRDQIIVQETIRQVIGANIRVTDNEIADYYREQRHQFELTAARRISTIFLPFTASGPVSDHAAVRLRAQQIVMLAGEGADFAELARKFSQGPHHAQGGDVGFVTRGEILPVLEEAAFARAAGDPPVMIETSTGVHLLLVTAERPGRLVPLSEARQRIQATLTEQKQSEKYQDWIDGLKTDSFIDRKL